MMSSTDLRVFFLPFLSPGHMIPMVDLAKIFASRGVKSTIVTTTSNVRLIQPTIDRSPHPIQLLTLRFPPSVAENVTALPTPDLTPDFTDALDTLKTPLDKLLREHRPDCIISDIFYPWSADLAADFGIPRLAFHGTSSFSVVVLSIIGKLKPHESVAGKNEPFVVPGIPHRIEMMKSQLPGAAAVLPDNMIIRIMESQSRTYGTVMNTFYEIEPDYADRFKNSKVWHVGPVSLCNRDTLDRAVRGGKGHDFDECLNWLNNKYQGSVLYVCFGSLGRFTCSQLREIAVGLDASDHPFIWVVRDGERTSEWMPEGFEEKVVGEGKGLIIRGWAPQILVLNHHAVGGFMTHCGWNSCLEGVTAGVPMITWPLFAEQFFNERLMVDVLRIGVSVGVKVCSGREEERTEVTGEDVKKAVNELMGGGDKADGRRKRAKEVAEKAKGVVEEGGSSYNDMSSLIQELLSIRAAGKVEYSGESLVQG